VTPVVIRDARAEDASRIAEIAAISWADTYRGIFDQPFIEDFLAQAYNIESLGAAITRADASDEEHFLVAARDGRVVAYAQYAAGPRGPQLFRIYADPDHYGTGAGSALLDELERRVAGSIDGYLVDVHALNARGRAFYERRGFVVKGDVTPSGELTLFRQLDPPEATSSNGGQPPP
jgi:GNAT superfamily N-acetyltransferase